MASSTDHGLALVPLGSGYHQSTDVLARRRSVDTGLLAEALIYYDRILISVDNSTRFAELVGLLIEQGLPAAELIGLFRDGVIQVCNFAFTTNPYMEFRESGAVHVHQLVNLTHQQSAFTHFLSSEKLRSCFSTANQFKEFVRAAEARALEITVEDIGSHAIDNAWRDFLDPERNALIAQQLVNEVYRINRLGKPPKVRVEITPSGDGHEVRWNIPLHLLPAVDMETNIAAAATLPLSIAAEANKYLWTARRAKCDLFLTKPVSMAVGDKLFEITREESDPGKIERVIDELEIRVEFPDVRRYVNDDRIDFDRALGIRKKASRFRKWLQSEAEHDRDAIIAYHSEIAKQSGFGGMGRRALRLFGFVGGTVMGATIGHDVSHGALGGVAGHLAQRGLEKGVDFLFDLGANVGVDWKPICFGDWYKTKIKSLLDKER
jgi:hypothetical protein